jgi:nuclear cap-binding protein subunit 2
MIKEWVSLVWKPDILIKPKYSTSTNTLYIGNLSYSTKENQVWEIFNKVGKVKRIIMGLNRYTLTSCGFCFIEFFTKNEALWVISYLNGIKIGNRLIRIDFDEGFKKGRQFGRGGGGGQIIDEMESKTKKFIDF